MRLTDIESTLKKDDESGYILLTERPFSMGDAVTLLYEAPMVDITQDIEDNLYNYILLLLCYLYGHKEGCYKLAFNEATVRLDVEASIPFGLSADTQNRLLLLPPISST